MAQVCRTWMGTATGSLGDIVMSDLGSMSLKVSPVPFVTYKSKLVSKVTRGYTYMHVASGQSKLVSTHHFHRHCLHSRQYHDIVFLILGRGCGVESRAHFTRREFHILQWCRAGRRRWRPRRFGRTVTTKGPHASQ
jgi:hypothetical protein